MKKRIPRPTLSDLAIRVMHLADVLAGGSQRGLAKLAGCSHSVVAKVANGKQEPGRELLEKIACIPQVNGDWLTTGRGEALLKIDAEDRRVPFAEALLPGLPTDHRTLLSSRFEVVSNSVYRESLYAVDAAQCGPANCAPDEHLRVGDVIFVDADPCRWTGNLQSLNGKLCVVALGGPDSTVITMRRVSVVFSTETQSWVIAAPNDGHVLAEADARRIREEFGKWPRALELDDESDGSEELVEIPPSSIRGKAIWLHRAL